MRKVFRKSLVFLHQANKSMFFYLEARAILAPVLKVEKRVLRAC